VAGSSSSRQVYDESGVFLLTNGYLTEGRKNAKNIQETHNMEKNEKAEKCKFREDVVAKVFSKCKCLENLVAKGTY
jgi:hypothetical protein